MYLPVPAFLAKLVTNDNSHPHLQTPHGESSSSTENLFLNNNEQKSICALVAYTAYQRNIDEGDVLALLGVRYGIDDITKLRGKDYDDVIRYLVDLETGG